MKKILVKPNGKDKQYGALKRFSAIEPPIWLAIMANYYKGSKVIDAEVEDYTIEETLQRILSEGNDIEVKILAIGSHPSAHIQQTEVANKLSALLTKENIPNTVYTQLPFNPCKHTPPQWQYLPMEKYRAHNWHCWGRDSKTPYGVVFTSIGCPFNCSFCCVKDFYNTPFEQRPVNEVIADFHVMQMLGIKNIKIMDELFTFNPKRVKEICEGIEALDGDFNIWTYARIDIVNEEMLRSMRKAGITWVAYGIETGNDEIRKNISKGNFNKDKIREIVKLTKDCGINVLGNYMFGFWEDTIETMNETLEFAKELQCEYANFYCTVAYPGTKLYNDLKEKGYEFSKDYLQYAQYSKTFKPLPTKTLSSNDVLSFRDVAFEEYFTDYNYQSMMKNKFGWDTIRDIMNMTNIKIKRA